ncbi:phage tail protein [Kosakonia sacchari]|uniref:phage tail-collar fiber domain-containing protein n=1 Tax=Kosakonia sacchari TaxID=1158459 RepID=UPI002ACDE68E|nr:phage tail protein [Kosakonia sacchari]MDZ7322942.1 phage tail protein [Kosakonia sacchari]
MAQSAITQAFEAWHVNKIINNEPARPDRMIFALVEGQDENAEIDRDEGMPATADLRYETDITQYGAINENAVVYSVVLDTTIGNWDYNWIGLIDSESNTVLMIVHTATQSKIKTGGGQQGNSLIRNLVMEFTGAADSSQITVTPETWQIDYTARHTGMDERVRMENIDIYGAAAFRDDGFLVAASGSGYSVAPGLGYVAGLRCESLAATEITARGATKVWVDATWQGAATGRWEVSYSLRVATELENYEKDGFWHYVYAIASIDVNGVVTDLRPPFPLQQLQQQVSNEYLRIDGRFAEIKQEGEEAQQEARANLNIYSKDEVDKSCPYRVGDVLLTQSHVSPAESWPGTEWADMSGDYNARTIMIGAEALNVGGEDTISLGVENMPSHSHSLTGLRTGEAGNHSHLYDKYQKGGTQDSTRVSVDNTRLGIEQAYTHDSGSHSHSIEGEIGASGGNLPFSIVSRYVTLRGWLRTA